MHACFFSFRCQALSKAVPSILLTVRRVIFRVLRFTMLLTSKGGMTMASNSCTKNAMALRWISFWRRMIPRRMRATAAASRWAFLFLRFELDFFNRSILEIRSSMYLQRRTTRPMSRCPILPVPLVGEYHVNGVRTPGSIETA